MQGLLYMEWIMFCERRKREGGREGGRDYRQGSEGGMMGEMCDV